MQIPGTLRALALPMLLGVTALLLWPAVHGPFLFDDFPNLQNLREINGNPSWRSIGVYLSLFPGSPGRPLATLSFLLNDVDWPSAPLGFKVTNLLIHLLNGVLVFGLARTLSRTIAGTTRAVADQDSDRIALLCAAIWLVSPIQISAVFLTIQRMTELAATFAFVGLWAFLALLPRIRSWHMACLAVTVLGVGSLFSFLCKENGALVPLLALAACVTVLRPVMATLPRASRWILLAALTLPTLFVASYLFRRILIAPVGPFSGRSFGLWERLMTEPRVLVDYIGLIVAPRLSSSSLYNDDYVISHGLLDPPTTLPAIIFIAGLAGAGWFLRKRKPIAAFGILWFMGSHLLEATTIALELYFEHRNYLPLFGPAFSVAYLVQSARGKLRLPARVGICAWLILAAGIIHLQARAWGSEERLATFWHVEHPQSLRAQQYYASYLLKHGAPDAAREIMERTNRQQTSPFESLLQVMTLDCDAGRTISSQKLDQAMALAATATPKPGTALILQRMRKSVQAGHCPESISPAVWLDLTERVVANPNGQGIKRMLLVERAELYLATRQLDAAIAELERAYGEGRNAKPRVAFYAAALLATVGRYDEARAWAARPLSLPWTWKGWLAQTDQQAIDLIKAIDRAKRQDSRRNADGA